MTYSNDAWLRAQTGWREARHASTEDESEQILAEAEDSLRDNYGLNDAEIEDIMMKTC